MNCFNHPDLSAVALCLGCGKAICRDCIARSDTKRRVCSPECGAQVKTMDLAFDLVTKKSLRSYSLIWRFLVLAAMPMVVLGLVNVFFEKDSVAIGLFDLGSSAVFLLVGYWYYRLTKRDA